MKEVDWVPLYWYR